MFPNIFKHITQGSASLRSQDRSGGLTRESRVRQKAHMKTRELEELYAEVMRVSSIIATYGGMTMFFSWNEH